MENFVPYYPGVFQGYVKTIYFNFNSNNYAGHAGLHKTFNKSIVT